jgi:hypothetical protein
MDRITEEASSEQFTIMMPLQHKEAEGKGDNRSHAAQGTFGNITYACVNYTLLVFCPYVLSLSI